MGRPSRSTVVAYSDAYELAVDTLVAYEGAVYYPVEQVVASHLLVGCVGVVADAGVGYQIAGGAEYKQFVAFLSGGDVEVALSVDTRVGIVEGIVAVEAFVVPLFVEVAVEAVGIAVLASYEYVAVGSYYRLIHVVGACTGAYFAVDEHGMAGDVDFRHAAVVLRHIHGAFVGCYGKTGDIGHLLFEGYFSCLGAGFGVEEEDCGAVGADYQLIAVDKQAGALCAEAYAPLLGSCGGIDGNALPARSPMYTTVPAALTAGAAACIDCASVNVQRRLPSLFTQ